ncbi:MAG: OadG family transporter subunit [Clostridiaceae bacterium]|nr:OadG family transporter subunit [Clostridiaceae bacterium]
MTIGESLAVALFCMAMVIAVLGILCLLLKLFSFLIGGIAAYGRKSDSGKIPDSPALQPELDSGGGSVRLIGVDEPTAAMIMAIVSDESEIPLSELCFKSIKALPDQEQAIEGK